VSIGSGWSHWTRQASARIPTTERWIGPDQVTGHPSHASPTRTAFRSGVPCTGAAFARGRKCGGELASRLRWRRAPRCSSHAVARPARAALPGSPRPPRRPRTSRADAGVRAVRRGGREPRGIEEPRASRIRVARSARRRGAVVDLGPADDAQRAASLAAVALAPGRSAPP
jgi:hypothetical protein